MDFEAPTLRAGINGTLLHVEANDALSGIAAVFVNDELYTTLENGELNVRIDNLRDDAYLYIDALDNAGNWTDYVVLANPFYEEEPEPTPTPTPTPDTGDDEHDEHCPTDCDCRKNNTSGSSSGSSFGGSSGGASSVSGGSKMQARLHRPRHLPRLRLPPRNPSQKRTAPALRRTAIPSRAICFTTNTATSSLSPSRPATARPSIW